jgi:hypothetical protein
MSILLSKVRLLVVYLAISSTLYSDQVLAQSYLYIITLSLALALDTSLNWTNFSLGNRKVAQSLDVLRNVIDFKLDKINPFIINII